MAISVALMIVPLATSFVSGQKAKRCGRKFWPWFFIGTALPFIANIILHYLPGKLKPVPGEVRPVENSELFDHLFITPGSKKYKS
ncbi:MAG: hypothetical protein ABL876_02705 [Chitinophagaceae bacterium]